MTPRRYAALIAASALAASAAKGNTPTTPTAPARPPADTDLYSDELKKAATVIQDMMGKPYKVEDLDACFVITLQTADVTPFEASKVVPEPLTPPQNFTDYQGATAVRQFRNEYISPAPRQADANNYIGHQLIGNYTLGEKGELVRLSLADGATNKTGDDPATGKVQYETIISAIAFAPDTHFQFAPQAFIEGPKRAKPENIKAMLVNTLGQTEVTTIRLASCLYKLDHPAP